MYVAWNESTKTKSQFWDYVFKITGQTQQTFPRVVVCKEISPGVFERQTRGSETPLAELATCSECVIKIKKMKNTISTTAGALMCVGESKSFYFTFQN